MKIIKEFTLDFCTIQYRNDGIVVFEFADGINVDAEMAKQLRHLADENINQPFGILSNRINSYSLSFDAMSVLANYNNIAALAIIVHSSKSQMLVETQNFFISKLRKMPIKIFRDADTATEWLHNELNAVLSQDHNA
jgi:hypothetical protein